MNLSICIPTYNRARLLENCLHSIVNCIPSPQFEYEVCISDNGSTDETNDVIQSFTQRLNIVTSKNQDNMGHVYNFLRFVDMAKGDFVWLIGDDDFLLPDALLRLNSLLRLNPNVDFFYINAFHMNTSEYDFYKAPIDTATINRSLLTKFSTINSSFSCDFDDLIDPSVSFDFLGGIFLSVFRRNLWDLNKSCISNNAIKDRRQFSHFDNTFPHVKIFGKAFMGKRAYYNNDPFSICLTGAREWDVMYPFIHSVRLVECVDHYYRCGLSYEQYRRCKSFALENLVPDLVNILIRPGRSGLRYLSWRDLLVNIFTFPSSLLSVPRFIIRFFRRKLLQISNIV